MDRALSALERNLKDDPTSPEDLKLKGIILALGPAGGRTPSRCSSRSSDPAGSGPGIGSSSPRPV